MNSSWWTQNGTWGFYSKGPELDLVLMVFRLGTTERTRTSPSCFLFMQIVVCVVFCCCCCCCLHFMYNYMQPIRAQVQIGPDPAYHHFLSLWISLSSLWPSLMFKHGSCDKTALYYLHFDWLVIYFYFSILCFLFISLWISAFCLFSCQTSVFNNQRCAKNCKNWNKSQRNVSSSCFHLAPGANCC